MITCRALQTLIRSAVSLLGSRFVIIDETEDEIEFLRLNDFKQFHQNLKIKITSADGGQKSMSLWITG